MRKSQYADLLESDDRQNQGSESSEYQVESINQRGCQSASADAKRYHKIPLKTQILLFQMVFVNGKRIKQVAKSLGINYSSAKSLIHYYKNNKRPIPSAISSILNQAKPCGIKKTKHGNKNMFVVVQIQKNTIKQYNFYQLLQQQQNP
ncbi:unnamed protein product (macronuclear) [Paramecium tetraurelia]|uniref:Paired domain-containing protein n=1 Tax=Paramecium tetraurelia TaxID=5888 RepID=A0CZP9_PARTE|nr:uncharacterized protein GSPATT00011839001 [Paramecium tetraurelia]CAK76266.1 unnamed protein product [Paramecium tetraurelia]|eukprot:XP_001443663.1 hypothetical protein (macronuclear) [Paramecium tetraurelia strain d4-2]